MREGPRVKNENPRITTTVTFAIHEVEDGGLQCARLPTSAELGVEHKDTIAARIPRWPITCGQISMLRLESKAEVWAPTIS